MSRIIAATMDPPTAMILADTSVTATPKGVTAHLLQKVYQVAPHVAAAFAGDVRAGFALVAALRSAPPVAYPGSATQRLLEAYAALAAPAPVQLLVAGVFGNTQDATQGFAGCMAYESPEFAPRIGVPGRVLAIGAADAAQLGEDVERLSASFASIPSHADMPENEQRSLWSQTARVIFGTRLRRAAGPLPSATALQAMVDPSGVQILPVDLMYPDQRIRPVGRLLTSWADVEAWRASLNLGAAGAGPVIA